MTADETIALRVTGIGGKRWPDDFTVIWRTLSIGRIMLALAASRPAMAMELQLLWQARRRRQRIRR
jgi:hypothetical protein